VDGGRRRAEVERTRAVLQERVAAYRQSVLDAYREVEDALAANRTGEERVLRLAETEQATEAALRLSLQRYLYGVSDYLPVLTAQRNHFQTQSELLSARRQLIASRISLARALGGDWMNDMIEQRSAALQGEQQP
jgi:outer membrane protein TolC